MAALLRGLLPSPHQRSLPLRLRLVALVAQGRVPERLARQHHSERSLAQPVALAGECQAPKAGWVGLVLAQRSTALAHRDYRRQPELAPRSWAERAARLPLAEADWKQLARGLLRPDMQPAGLVPAGRALGTGAPGLALS